MKPSRTTGVIKRAFDKQYPEGSSLLLVGSVGCRPIELHETMMVSRGSSSYCFKAGKKCYETCSKTEEEGVTVVSTEFEASSDFTELFYKEVIGFDALIYMIDALEESSVGRLKTAEGIISDLMKAMNPDNQRSVALAVLAINTRMQGAKKKTYLCAQLKETLKVADRRRLFVVNPKNRLGLLRPIYFLGDQLFLLERERQRLTWKRERWGERLDYDDRKQNRKSKREQERLEEENEKEKFHGILDREAKSDGDAVMAADNSEVEEDWDDIEVEERDENEAEEMEENEVEERNENATEVQSDSSVDSESGERFARYSSTDPPSDEA